LSLQANLFYVNLAAIPLSLLPFFDLFLMKLFLGIDHFFKDHLVLGVRMLEVFKTLINSLWTIIKVKLLTILDRLIQSFDLVEPMSED
jgi:hypothetical protein